MCIYERKLKNIKYLPNKKNNGIPPYLEDKRLEYITTNCGWCKECRAKIANDWKIRLTEEIKFDKTANFVTLTFAPESLVKLESVMHIKKWRGIENEDGELLTDVNLLAAYAVRMWSERWRKHMKKAPKHWLITELGHNQSERIHLHGLIWGDVKLIEKTWQYGQIYCGQWVDERTINYITKYVTKLDNDHKGYKQRIMTSKGIGKNYVIEKENYHQFKGENTIKKYKSSNGREMSLPRYYKQKLWNEEEREELWKLELEKPFIYVGGEKIDKSKIDIDTFNKKLETIRKYNKLTGYGDNTTVNKTYVITELMRKKHDEIKDYRKDKLVTEETRRNIESIIESKKTDTVSKANNVSTIIYGKYIGTTTEAQRNYNDLLEEANAKKISIRTLRLIKAGIIVNNSVEK